MDRANLLARLTALTHDLVPGPTTRPADLADARAAVAHALLGGSLEGAATHEEATVEAAFVPSDIVAVADAALRAAETATRPGPVVVHRTAASPTLLPDALRAITAGRAADASFGPFVDALGRDVWVDRFDPVERVALVRAGAARPFAYAAFRVGAGTTTRVTLGPGSVWTAAPALAAGAPPNGFVGLRITGGTIDFGAAVAYDAASMTVPAWSTVEITLTLDPPSAPPGNGPGADARQATVAGPATVTLRLAPAGASVVRADDALVAVFGWTSTLRSAAGPVLYDALTNRVEVPYAAERPAFEVADQRASLAHLDGRAPVTAGAWSVPVTAGPTGSLGTAAGAGGVTLHLAPGLDLRWSGRDVPTSCGAATIVVDPGVVEVFADAARSPGVPQHLPLWTADAPRAARGSLDLRFPGPVAVRVVSEALGLDGLIITPALRATLDRPVTINGERLRLEAPLALVVFAETAAGTRVGVEAVLAAVPRVVRAIALKNAVVGVSDARTLLASGTYTDGAVGAGALALTFGLAGLLPILPDPYATTLVYDARGQGAGWAAGAWAGVLTTVTRWAPNAQPTLDVLLPAAVAGAGTAASAAEPAAPAGGAGGARAVLAAGHQAPDAAALPAVQRRFEVVSGGDDAFALLDVSTNVSLFGVGYASGPRAAGVAALPPSAGPALAVEDLYLAARGRSVRVLTLPAVQWEPVVTVDDPQDPGFPSPLGFPDSGTGALIATDTVALVPLAPRPAIDALVARYNAQEVTTPVRVVVRFTLPFGIVAVAELERASAPPSTPPAPVRGPFLDEVRPVFTAADLAGGDQLSFRAAESLFVLAGSESPGFPGVAVQLHNARYLGVPSPETVLGPVDVTFDSNFGVGAARPRVPVTRFDLSGFGESVFSDWRNPADGGAVISKAQFEVIVGRTRLEVVQAHSLLYPYAVRVVRTIAIERTNGGTMARRDSGWQPASDGRYDFPASAGIVTHPGVVRGVTQVSNIRDTGQRFTTSDGTTELMAVHFDCLIDVEGVVAGGTGTGVPSRDQIGYVQLTNALPMTPPQYAELLAAAGTLGGAVDCLIDVGGSGQRMRVAHVGVAATPGMGGPEFAVAAWGSPSFPGGGAWSFLRQRAGNEAPAAVDRERGVPLVRAGAAGAPSPGTPYRITDPEDALTPDAPQTEYGIVHSTGTQRTYFPRPKIEVGTRRITSVRTPYLADPYSLGTAIDLFPRLDATIPFPDANYALAIDPSGNYELQLPTPSFQPPPLTRTLLDAPPIKTTLQYADEHGAPSTVAVEIDTAAVVPWRVSVQNLSVAAYDGDHGEITRLVSDVDAGADHPTALANSRLVWGPALHQVRDVLALLQHLGILPPPTVAMTNDAKLSVGLKIDAEKLGEQDPALKPILEEWIVDLDLTTLWEIWPTGTESTVQFELTVKIRTPFPPLRAIALAWLDVKVPSTGSASATLTLGYGAGISYNVGPFNITAYLAETWKLVRGDNTWGLGAGIVIRGTVDLFVATIQSTIEANEVFLFVRCPPTSEEYTVWGVSQLSYAFELTIAWVIDIDYETQAQAQHNLNGGPCPLPDVL